jgi:ABC-type amino acid transport substrate-binding protein
VGPLVANVWVFVGKESFEEKIRDISEPQLKTLRIGTLKGGAIDDYLKKFGIKSILFGNGFECALALKQNKIDLWATGEPIAVYYSKRLGPDKIKKVFLLKGNQFMYLGLNLKTPDSLVRVLNKELGNMRRDGTIRDIYRKYQGY